MKSARKRDERVCKVVLFEIVSYPSSRVKAYLE